MIESVIKERTRRSKKVIVARDFNAKSTSWRRVSMDKRGRVLMKTLYNYGVFPLRLNQKYTFHRNGRTSCPDIISVTSSTSIVRF